MARLLGVIVRMPSFFECAAKLNTNELPSILFDVGD